MEKQVKLVLLYTSDVHSAFPAIPRIAGTVSRLRRIHEPAPVLMTDCGDHMDRMSLVTEGSAGKAHIALLGAIGYNVITLGNNEGLTFSKDCLRELYGSSSGLTVTVANLREKETGCPPAWMKRSHIWTGDGIRVGLIGATAPYYTFYDLLGWQADDPFAAVKREVEALRNMVDVIVVLSHLGLSVDKRMAEELESINVIIGGHTHHVLESPLLHGSTLLCGCGMSGRYVGELELIFDSKSRKLAQATGRLHATEGEAEDAEVKSLIAQYAQDSERAMNRPAALLDEPLAVSWDRDSPLGNLLAAGLRKWTGADIGLINSGQVLQSALAGNITRGVLLSLCPSPVNPCLMQIKGSALRLALEQSLLDDFVHMPLYGNGFRGKYLGGLCVDGLEVAWSRDAEPYHRIAEIRVGGQLLEPDQEYRVGTADMFTFGTGYLSLKEGRHPRYFLPEFLRDVLEKELNDPMELSRCRLPRYRQVDSHA